MGGSAAAAAAAARRRSRIAAAARRRSRIVGSANVNANADGYANADANSNNATGTRGGRSGPTKKTRFWMILSLAVVFSFVLVLSYARILLLFHSGSSSNRNRNHGIPSLLHKKKSSSNSNNRNRNISMARDTKDTTRKIFRDARNASSTSTSTSTKREPEPEPEQRPLSCTRDELLKVRNQLDPELCPTARKIPQTQFCSITQATKCVDSGNWLDKYYRELYEHKVQAQALHNAEPFLGISVGCNKGFDALNTLRMGTYDGNLKKRAWKRVMERDGKKLRESVCEQDKSQEFRLPANSSSNIVANGEMHCFEPMPQTFRKLQYSARHLRYDKKGFRVVHAAISNQTGTALFDTYERATATTTTTSKSTTKSTNKDGIENVGLSNCERMNQWKKKKYCSEVTVVTLKDYVEQHIDVDSNGNETSTLRKTKRTIHHLSIDVEGYDADVLLGAGPDLLKRVEYLEFEYNYMGSWGKQHLYDVISQLDGTSTRSYNGSTGTDTDTNENGNNNNNNNSNGLSFTCYWAGQRRLWRITGCWMRYYDIHTWANVACVNRKLVPKLASRMEAVFRTTLNEDVPKNKYRHRRWFVPVYSKNYNTTIRNDPMLVTDPHEAMVSTEYL